jgi:hypothetical protein
MAVALHALAYLLNVITNSNVVASPKEAKPGKSHCAVAGTFASNTLQL